MQLAVNNIESIVMSVRSQMARFADINVKPAAVLMNSQHYRSLLTEMKYSMVKGNDDPDSVNGLPIVIAATRDVTVAVSPSELDNVGLL